MSDMTHGNITAAGMNIDTKKKSPTPSIEIYKCRNWHIGNIVAAGMTIGTKGTQLEWHFSWENMKVLGNHKGVGKSTKKVLFFFGTGAENASMVMILHY